MHRNVLEYLQNAAAEYPDKTAVIDETSSLSYAALFTATAHIGNELTARKDASDFQQASVVVFIDKSIDCLKAMLGTLYCGDFYVVMDTQTPAERFRSVIEILENKVLITVPEYAETVRQLGYEGRIYLVGDLEKAGESAQDFSEWKKRIDTDLLYVPFTSGSTGVPKGIAVSHRSVIDYVEAYVEELDIRPKDVLGNQSPFYFDVSLRDIYMALKTGATLCIIPSKYFMTPKKLLEFLEENKVTSIAWVATAYRMVAQFKGLQKIRPSKLEKFVFCGEAMPADIFNYWKREYPDGIFYQQYGLTEITGVSSIYRVDREFTDEETIPIGKAFPNMDLFLIGDNGEYLPPSCANRTGEIYVRGTSVAPGYYNNPERTKEQFVQNPLQDRYPEMVCKTGDLAYWNERQELIFLSRRDLQVKHGGHRIELGEIEHAVLSMEGINACCCVQERKKDEIVCFYAGTTDEKEAYIQARRKLVKYMLPSSWHRMEELPVLPNGKLNRRELDERVNGEIVQTGGKENGN